MNVPGIPRECMMIRKKSRGAADEEISYGMYIELFILGVMLSVSYFGAAIVLHFVINVSRVDEIKHINSELSSSSFIGLVKF